MFAGAQRHEGHIFWRKMSIFFDSILEEPLTHV